MSLTDLRGWLAQVQEIGELVEIAGVDSQAEMGTLTEITQHEPYCPAILFTEIPGVSSGRILVNTLGTVRRMGATVGIQGPDSTLGFVRSWKEWIKGRIPIAPRQVKDGPVLEHVQRDEQVDLHQFPAPLWHEQDGGKYLGTAAVTISRDPSEGWINLGVYRIMLHGRNEISCTMSPGKHGRIHRDQTLESGEPWRVAISFGHHPIFFLVGSLELPPKLSEYDVIGGMLGEPVEVITGETSGLPIPAWSEMTIEGICTGKDRRPEGPFGEFTGYYASGTRPEYIIKVDRIYHRTNPILLGNPPLRPPSENAFWQSLVRSAILWDELEKAGVPDIQGVWRMPASGSRMINVVSIKQRYPGHARQVGHLAAQVRSGAYIGRYVIVVDEDIDPTDTDQVLWALSTRSDPESSIDIVRRCWSGPLDPIIPKNQKGFSSRAVIDACRPYEWKDEFPPVVGASPEEAARVRAKYAQILGLRANAKKGVLDE